MPLIIVVVKQKGAEEPFVNKSRVISASDTEKITVSDLIRQCIVGQRPNMEYSEDDFVSVKSRGGTDLTDLLDEPLSLFLQLSQVEERNEIDVVIDRPRAAQPTNSLATLMEQSNDASEDGNATQTITSGKFFKRLIKLPLEELRCRKLAREAFASAMTYPQQQVESRFRQLSVGGKQVEVRTFPDDERNKQIEDALRRFDPNYSPDFRAKGDLKKMTFIKEFFESPDHCRMSPYSIEFRLCGKDRCPLCINVGRSVRTPATDGGKLRVEILRWLNRPVPNPVDKDHYLHPQAGRDYIDRNNLSFEQLEKYRPDAKKDSREMERLKKDKERDKKKKTFFDKSKVRSTVTCDSCGAERCIYSKTVEVAKQRSKELEQWKEGGYVCGNKVRVEGFEAQRKLRCNDQMETQYYDMDDKKRGGRIETKIVCAVCYLDDDLVLDSEVIEKRDLKGKSPLPICRSCSDYNTIPVSGGRTNNLQKAKQNKAEMMRRLDDAVKSGKRKGRKN